MTEDTKQNLYALMLAFLVFLSLFFMWIQVWEAAIGPAFLAFLIYISKLKKNITTENNSTNENINKE